MKKPVLDITNVHKTYRGRQGNVLALDNVSLQINPGDFVAVQGHSGSGKSTLLLAAGGLLAPDDGQVLVADENLYALSPENRAKYRARMIGYVFQQYHLVPYLSVKDNVLTASLALPNANALERAEALIKRFGLTHRAAHVPAELSVGERQRAALARSLLNSPVLLLADEPTGNLDEKNADIVLRHMADFAAEGGAVLMVTHDPRAARRAGKIVHVNEGRIAVQ